TATASDPEQPANGLTFGLIGAPVGAAINPMSGAFTWTPTEAQGPGSFTFTVRVTEDGSPALSAEEQITVTLAEANQAPVLAPIHSKTADEQPLLSFTTSTTDPDLPANALTYSASGLPAGAVFDPATRTFSWTPTEAQGPGSYDVTFDVSDGGLAASEAVRITVIEVNRPPALAPIADRSTPWGAPVTFTASASDPDLPVNILTY